MNPLNEFPIMDPLESAFLKKSLLLKNYLFEITLDQKDVDYENIYEGN